MVLNKWNILTAALLVMAGCHSSRDSETRVGGSGKINPADLKFETTEDPPLKANTHFAAGQLAETQGDLSVAVDQYWKAVKIQPKCKDALYRLGIVYCRLEHYPDAIVAWKEYIKATEGDAVSYSNLGFCHELAGQHAEAEGAYRNGLLKDSKSNPCRVNYGLMLARDGRIAEATLQLQVVLSPAEVHYNIASIYEHQGKKEQARTGLRDAAIVGTGMIRARRVAVGVTDSAFIMGSMGAVVGEKLTRLIERATEQRLPLIIISASGGGARMHEGILSLMQMAKVSAALGRYDLAGGLFISVLTNPTMGGVAASFASLGDIIFAEPKALIGFAGPRTIQATIRIELPKGFQTSEFLLEHG